MNKKTITYISVAAAALVGYYVFTGKKILGLKCRSYPELISEYRNMVIQNNYSNVSSEFVLAIIFTESCGDPEALGDWKEEDQEYKSLGLMQLQKKAWIDSGVPWTYNKQNAFDPVKNIRAGCGHLGKLYSITGDVNEAIVAYNIGYSNMVNGNLLDKGKLYLQTVLKHWDKIIRTLQG